VNATELVAYDQAKQTFLSMGRPDNVPTHILSGLTAGLAATLLGSPVDVVKTRVMAARAPAAGAPGGSAHVPEFKGPIDCAVKLLKTQGPLAFYSQNTRLDGIHTAWGALGSALHVAVRSIR
jgi:solute carrier family 25 uncoupling protein 8/9